jgi:hypothetical protein
MELPSVSREIVTGCLAVIDGLAPLIDRIDGELHQHAKADPRVNEAVDDFAAARNEEVRPFLAERVDEHQAPAVFRVVIRAGPDRRIAIGVVNFDEQAIGEMPQGQ